MTFFQVDSERVFAANANIQTSITRLNQEVSSLHAQLTALQDSWQGTAANSFQELMQRWRVSADSLEASLGQIGQALQTAAQQYQEIESANQRLFL
jgi:6 kDa early secretory antigenic target